MEIGKKNSMSGSREVCAIAFFLDDFPALKHDRSPECGRPSGIEGARCLRMDADYVALVS
jgi:hypothetical protein